MMRIARLSIAPVRSLGLEHPTEAELTKIVVVEDRRFYLIDEAGRLVDLLIASDLVRVAAHTNADATTLRMTFPDASVVEEEVRLGEPVETAIHGRTGVGHVVIGPWGDALEPYAHRRVRVVRCDRAGGTRIANAISLISDGSLRELAQRVGQDEVDARRFRMLLQIEGAEPHAEDAWIGGEIAVGTAVLSITKPDARCAITTQNPDTGVRDLDTLRTIIAYRGLREGHKADFGVLGEVEVPGRVAVGDEVIVTDRTTPPVHLRREPARVRTGSPIPA